MRKYKIAPEVREQIINRIKNDGVSVAQAAKGPELQPGGRLALDERHHRGYGADASACDEAASPAGEDDRFS